MSSFPHIYTTNSISIPESLLTVKSSSDKVITASNLVVQKVTGHLRIFLVPLFQVVLF